jgi:hypothetical protein
VLELSRGLRAARVHDDDAATPLGDRVHLVLDPRCAHHAAVRDHRVCAEHEEEVRAREVRDRDEERRAIEEVARGETVRDVLRRRGVEVVRAEAVEEALHPQRVGVGERAGVPHVPADRLAAVPLADRAQAAADVVERLVPADALEALGGAVRRGRAAAHPPQRVGDAVRVVLDLGHRDPLRAGEPARDRVVGVRPQLGDPPVLYGRDEPAERLADPAVGDSLLARHFRRSSPPP